MNFQKKVKFSLKKNNKIILLHEFTVFQSLIYYIFFLRMQVRLLRVFIENLNLIKHDQHTMSNKKFQNEKRG